MPGDTSLLCKQQGSARVLMQFLLDAGQRGRRAQDLVLRLQKNPKRVSKTWHWLWVGQEGRSQAESE